MTTATFMLTPNVSVHEHAATVAHSLIGIEFAAVFCHLSFTGLAVNPDFAAGFVCVCPCAHCSCTNFLRTQPLDSRSCMYSILFQGP